MGEVQENFPGIDPNSCLRRMRALSEEIQSLWFERLQQTDLARRELPSHLGALMASYFQELDTWMTHGGQLPADWVHPSR